MAEEFVPDVVVLCAGFGKRLRPLTETIPKALVPVRGEPLLGHHLRAMHSAGIRRAVCVIGYLGNQVRTYVESVRGFGIDIDFVQQDPPNGTGGAVIAATSHITTDPFAVLYSDVLFQPMTTIWLSLLRDPTAKILCARVQDASQLGRVLFHQRPEGMVLDRIVEKDGFHSPGLVNAGLLLLPKIVLELLEKQGESPRGEVELPPVVETLAQSGNEIHILSTERWTDIGNHHALAVAEVMVDRQEVRLD